MRSRGRFLLRKPSAFAGADFAQFGGMNSTPAFHALHENIFYESQLLESEESKDFKLLELLKSQSGRTIVYCATSKAADYVHKFLNERGITSLRYHQRMRAAERLENLRNFELGRPAVLIVCKDCSSEVRGFHVRMVVHYNYPVSIEDYSRETSCAGTDGEPTRCSLLFLGKDKRAQKRDAEAMKLVTRYAQSALCRSVLLAKHLGIENAEACHRCDNCLKTPKSQPKLESQRIDLDALVEASI